MTPRSRRTNRPLTFRRSRRLIALAVPFAVSLSACRDPGAVEDRRNVVAVLAGDAQFAVEGGAVAEALQVVVSDAVTRTPREGVKVEWRITAGTATLTPSTSTTDSRGIATTMLRMGPGLGTAKVRATPTDLVGNAADFSATAVQTPAIASITPATARAGDTVTITGSNFGTSAAATAAIFDGIRGLIVSVTPDRVRAVVPSCVASHTTSVRIALGAVVSASTPIATVAGNTPALRLERGQVRVFADPAELACIRLPPEPVGASYLLISQNVAETYSIAMPFELAAFGIVPPISASRAPIAANARFLHSANFASDWELRLRERERAMIARGAARTEDVFERPSARAQPDPPKVGDRRSFNTLNAKNETVRITAEVRAVTQRAILYQDVAAPAVFNATDYARFGELFDDPIFTTGTDVFGPVGDIDGNGRIIMVFTPQVNALTKKGTGSYIAGYFYACDLLAKSRCAASNGGEIFYSMVPDPAGTVSDAHSAASVFRVVPPVIAHEFMHMINFGQRGGTSEVLWLGEALAHTAEDVVGQVFLDRGDSVTAAEFIEQNHLHARVFLNNTANTSLIADESPGTIEMRGEGWLFLRYLRGLYGENNLLRELARAPETGSRNITARTGRTWRSLLSDFAVAIYADDAPTLAGVPLDPRYTFVNTNMRQMLGTGAPFPLVVRNQGFNDFLITGSLPSSAWHYTHAQSPVTNITTSLNLVFSGARGGPFTAAGVPQLTILRVR